ncbi:MAG: capsule assembly Wzi family protein [Prevotella sp.]
MNNIQKIVKQGSLIFILSFFHCALSFAQTDVAWQMTMQTTNTTGANTPLWLNANRYGLSSLEKNNGYFMAGVEKEMDREPDKKWSYGFGVSLAAAYNFSSSIIVQEAYVEGRWLKGSLTLGAKEEPMQLKNQSLSSGSQTLGVNARPVPSLRLSLDDYWAVPFTNGWLRLKGHIAYGITTDDTWQREFTSMTSRYTEDTFLHTKAGYLKIGNEDRFFPVSLEMGLEMASQFGGNSYRPMGNGNMEKVENRNGIGAFWKAFLPGGSDVIETTYQNVSGNHLGSWVMRLNFDYDDWYLGLYADHFFDDHSAMFLLDYDGYGTGEEWNTKKSHRYMLYDLKDIMLGAELKLKNTLLLNNILFEYVNTKYQSGPIYHDHTQQMPDDIGGIDNYYNHYIYTGWQHWGQTMGNPLYISPIYNDDGLIEFECNRFKAFHLGLSGLPTNQLTYRLLATYQKGYGTYNKPYPNPREGVSVMAEVSYSLGNGWNTVISAGLDRGKLRGNSTGLQLTFQKTGIIK